MDSVVFTTANVVTIGGFVIALAGVYWRLAIRVVALEKDMTDLAEKVDMAIQVGERTAKSLADVATQLAVLSERVGNLVKLQEAALIRVNKEAR